jgi:hypothetical protein
MVGFWRKIEARQREEDVAGFFLFFFFFLDSRARKNMHNNLLKE